MTFILSALRDDVEAELGDSGNLVWTTAEVDAAIARAKERYDTVSPLQQSATLTVTGRTADLSAAAPTGLGTTAYAALLRVVAAEYPVSQWPPAYVRHEVYGSTLTLHTASALAAASVKVFYEILHTLGATGDIPDRDRQLMVIGGAAYALQYRAQELAETVNTDRSTHATVLRNADARFAAFEEGLKRLGDRVRSRTLYRPEDPYLNSRDVVDFPS